MTKLDDALGEWSTLLGPEQVSRDPSLLERYGRTTLASAPGPLAVLRARSRDEVVEVVKIAARNRVPLYPISRGKNWGLGAACPPTEGQVVLDLGQMNRIVEVDEALAYAVIEPGVTQGQLADHLDDNNIGLIMDCTASGRDSSVLANCLERGDGFSPYGDRFLHCCGMEVVLADGSVVQTGFGDLAGPQLRYLYKWGVGPSLDGIFSQSNVGIVTRIGIWLYPEPEHITAFIFTLKDEARFGELIDRLRPLRQDGTIQNPVHIINTYRVLAGRGAYPPEREGLPRPLPPDEAARLIEGSMLGVWNGLGALYGTRAQVWAHKRALKRALGDLGRIYFCTPTQLGWGFKLADVMQAVGLRKGDELAGLLSGARTLLGLCCGIPTDEGLIGARWRLSRVIEPDSLDPLDNNVGLYWLTPLCPMTGEHARKLVDLASSLLLEHGFEPLLNCTLLNGRALLVSISLYYDRDDDGERERARSCYLALVDALLAAGYPPFRMPIEGMDRLGRDANAGPWPVAQRIKQALDPHDILAPGRYAPWTPKR